MLEKGAEQIPVEWCHRASRINEDPRGVSSGGALSERMPASEQAGWGRQASQSGVAQETSAGSGKHE
jgi:hypothetical protein